MALPPNSSTAPTNPLHTPDGRYLVVRGRLWRATNPHLLQAQKQALVEQLMNARSAVKAALQIDDAAALRTARQQVHHTKVALGERGAVWWSDGSPDYNRYLVKNTPYAEWYVGAYGNA